LGTRGVRIATGEHPEREPRELLGEPPPPRGTPVGERDLERAAREHPPDEPGIAATTEPGRRPQRPFARRRRQLEDLRDRALDVRQVTEEGRVAQERPEELAV